MQKYMINFFEKTLLLLFFVIVSGFNLFAESDTPLQTRSFTLDLYDSERQRVIPVAIDCPQDIRRNPVVIFSHGYDQNRGSAYKQYTYLTQMLAKEGYVVISIQHELSKDSPLAMTGNLYHSRMPNWERGVRNILFVRCEFIKIYPQLDWSNLTLIGHSNGGDMTFLFAQNYPNLIRKAISLDHRRMPVPRTGKIKIYSLRGCDYEADSDVFPANERECEQASIQILTLDHIKHGDMDNKGTSAQHQKICSELLKMLKE